jgi:hypothetical protein
MLNFPQTFEIRNRDGGSGLDLDDGRRKRATPRAWLPPFIALHTILDGGRKLRALHFSIFGQHFCCASGA